MSAVLERPTELILPTLPGCVVEVYETRDEWLAARGLGASESASILGVGYAEESPMTVWGRKLGKIPSMEDTQALRIGRKLERVILELFSEESGLCVDSLGQFTVCRSLKHPWLTASLDGHIIETDEGPAVAEAKNVGTFMARDWDDDDQPLKFQIQTQQQMEVAGVDIAYSVGLIGGNRLKWVKSYRNQKFIDAMIPKLAEFQELVDSQVEPSGKWIDGTEATKKALGKIHPLDNGETILLPLESADWHRDLTEAKKAKKAAETAVLLYGNHLQQAMGINSFGLLPDGTRYSNKHQDKQIYCCEKCGHSKRCQPFPVLRHSKK